MSELYFFNTRLNGGLYFLNKSEFLEVLEFEQKIQGTNKKFYSIMGNGKCLVQLAKECENEKKFMIDADWNEIYKMPIKETSCGAFCHR